MIPCLFSWRILVHPALITFRFLPCTLGLCLLLLGQPASTGELPAPSAPTISIIVDHAILALPDGPVRSATARVTASAHGFPRGARVEWSWRQIQDGMSPVAADMTKGHVVAIGQPDAASTAVTCTTFGVYALRVTAMDRTSGITISRNTWLSVWDDRSPILIAGKPDPLTPAPGITPPPRVRDLSPDPGPYRHPRLLCTDADWQDIRTRCLGGASRIATNSYATLARRSAVIFNPTSREGAAMAQLGAWADAGFPADAIPVLGGADRALGTSKAEHRQQVLAEEAVDAISRTLAEACFVQWLAISPTLPRDQVPAKDQERMRQLAKLVAAFSRASLDLSWNRETGVFSKDRIGYLKGLDDLGGACSLRNPLALAYDFSAPWMTTEQARDTRDFLIATGAGRSTGSRSRGFVVDGVVMDRGIDRGYSQNGNYASFQEGQILKALVVAGEEGGADPRVVSTFLTPPKPAKMADFTKSTPWDWMRPVAENSGRSWPGGLPYGESMSWPHARKVDVDNLQRAIFWNQDGNVSPWGFILEREAYHSTTESQWVSAIAYIRQGGHNQFVTGYFYHIINHLLFNQYPFGSERRGVSTVSNLQTFHHHCGGNGIGKLHPILLKYMYPDDLAVDYLLAARVPDLEKKAVSMEVCIFGVDPSLQTTAGAMERMALAKQLPLTKVDPEEGVVVMRSGWSDDALQIDLDCGFKGCGHMNAEKNSFAFFALGRSWALPPGYHKKFSNWQAGIQFQNPAWAACPVTQGYVGQNPSVPPDLPASGYPRSFPTPPGRLVDVWEAPDHSWSYAVGDASLTYNYMCSSEGERLSIPRSQAMYPGLLADISRRLPIARELFVEGLSGYYHNRDLYLIPSPWTAVKRAFRTIVMVRGKHPYVLIVDDFQRDDAPANYRWMFSNVSRGEDGKRGKAGDFLLDLEPGASPTEGILAHRPDRGQEPGRPRLLVRDVSESVNAKQPVLRMDRTRFNPPANEASDFYLQEDSNRLFIERQQVVDPRFKVLLFPFRTGETLPVTTWNHDRTILSIDHGKGKVDRISCVPPLRDGRTIITVACSR